MAPAKKCHLAGVSSRFLLVKSMDLNFETIRWLTEVWLSKSLQSVIISTTHVCVCFLCGPGRAYHDSQCKHRAQSLGSFGTFVKISQVEAIGRLFYFFLFSSNRLIATGVVFLPLPWWARVIAGSRTHDYKPLRVRAHSMKCIFI